MTQLRLALGGLVLREAMLSGVPRPLRRRRVPELLALVGLQGAARRKIRGF